jgi:hypothetical protein
MTKILHIEPVGGAGTVAQYLVFVDGEVFVAAVLRRDEEHLAILQEILADCTTGPGQVVERV